MNDSLFDSLFTSLLQSLLQIRTVSFTQETQNETLQAFSDKYCYNAWLQFCFSAKSLSENVLLLPKGALLELQDRLGIRALMLKLEAGSGRKETFYLLGPFVTIHFDEEKTRSALIEGGLPASYLPSLRLFYSAFPQISRQNAIHTINALTRVLFPDAEEFRYLYLGGNLPKPADQASLYETRFDYETVHRRYELENRFLKMIEEGDTAHVLAAFEQMEGSEVNSNRYINAVYFRPEISFSIVRVLSRKAAERGGASVMEINEITQRAVQQSPSASPHAAARHLKTMVLELTEAVRRHKEEEGRCSPPIQKVISYLRYNFSQDISLGQLAKLAAMAPSYLSRRFKEETGRTVSEAIRSMRCGQAARLLKETDLSIADISAFVGYPDSNYFVKVFRKEYGQTPGEWRKS